VVTTLESKQMASQLVQSRRYPWLRLHPQDCDQNLPAFVRVNPDTFLTPADLQSGGCRHTWGIDTDEFDGNPFQAMQRKMSTQFLYFDSKTRPEMQYIAYLMERKKASLAASKARTAPLLEQDYCLKVELIVIDYPERNMKPLAPVPVWRTVMVSGGITLCQLHDRVIAPAMGWVRNYHGYLFTDPTDGAMFGPAGSNAIDMMHMDMRGK
jgi:hypothetical protein